MTTCGEAQAGWKYTKPGVGEGTWVASYLRQSCHCHCHCCRHFYYYDPCPPHPRQNKNCYAHRTLWLHYDSIYARKEPHVVQSLQPHVVLLLDKGEHLKGGKKMSPCGPYTTSWHYFLTTFPEFQTTRCTKGFSLKSNKFPLPKSWRYPSKCYIADLHGGCQCIVPDDLCTLVTAFVSIGGNCYVRYINAHIDPHSKVHPHRCQSGSGCVLCVWDLWHKACNAELGRRQHRH